VSFIDKYPLPVQHSSFVMQESVLKTLSGEHGSVVEETIEHARIRSKNTTVFFMSFSFFNCYLFYMIYQF